MNRPAPQPGERRPGGQARLERAPGERYAGGAPRERPGPAPGTEPLRTLVVAGLVATAGAVAFFALALLDLGPGLIAAAAAIGWLIALALVWRGEQAGVRGPRTRIALAVALAIASLVAGFLLNWAWGRTEGGVLDPISYVVDRWGLLPWVDLVVAGAVAGLRAR